MNIEEVYTLSYDLWNFYLDTEHPVLYIQKTGHIWFLEGDGITASAISPSYQRLSEVVFWWVRH